MHGIYMLMLVLVTLMQGHSGSGKATKISVELSRQQRMQQALKLAAMVDHFLRDLDFANANMA